MKRVSFEALASTLARGEERSVISRRWRSIWRPGAVALAACILAACAQMPAALAPAAVPATVPFTATVAVPAAEVTPAATTTTESPTPGTEAGDLAGMKQFADAESNFALSIPAEWDVFGPDHNAIGSQFIMGPAGTGWTSGEPAAVQISVIDTETMTVGQALEMLCAAGCSAVPEPEPITLSNGMPVLRAVAATTEGAAELEWYIVEFGPKAIIFSLDQARAGMDWDQLLGTFGPLDATAPAGEDTGRVLYEGISFTVPDSVAPWASGESIAAEERGVDGPWWLPVPRHPEIRLVSYPVLSVQAPRVIVYPVEDFASANDEAARQIELLGQLLQEQPAQPGEQLPFLPLTNAGQVLSARVKYVSFQGGQGVSYLSQLAQGPGPVNNQELFYTFQGLTDDGAHYVAAILPVMHPSLPASFESLTEDERQALVDDFATYIEDATTALQAQADETFIPSLSDLDTLVQSINVAR